MVACTTWLVQIQNKPDLWLGPVYTVHSEDSQFYSNDGVAFVFGKPLHLHSPWLDAVSVFGAKLRMAPTALGEVIVWLQHVCALSHKKALRHGV